MRGHKKYKPIPPILKERLAAEIKMLMHAHRDCLRNQRKDTLSITFDINDGYFGEAFGMLRTLAILGYGDINGAVNTDVPGNLRAWFNQLEKEVLNEEGFFTDHKCDYCLNKWGKDDVRKKTSAGIVPRVIEDGSG